MRSESLAFVQSIIPLCVSIFSFLKEKGKGFPLQSGLGGSLWVCFWRHSAQYWAKCSRPNPSSWGWFQQGDAVFPPIPAPWHAHGLKASEKLSISNPTFPAPWNKLQKKVSIKLAFVEILCTFAPAFKAKFLYKHWKIIEKKSKKRFAGFGKGFYLCHPQNNGFFEIGWVEK